MILHINTTEGHDIEVAIKDKGKQVAGKRVSAKYSQAEKLLPLIDRILKDNKFNLKDIKKIEVNNNGGSPVSGHGTSFTALRIGVVTANALGYALKIPVLGKGNQKSKIKNQKSIIEPIYSKEPNITQKKA